MKKPIFSELPPPLPSSPPPTKISRRELYIVLVAAVAIAAVLTVFRLLPSGGEKISLILNYRKGEKMTYNVTLTSATGGEKTRIWRATLYMEVLDFDGEKYTIYYRFEPDIGSPWVYTVKVNKQGSIVGEVSKLPFEMQGFWASLGGTLSLPGFGCGFPKTEVVIGEVIQSPFSYIIDMWDMHINGTVKIRCSEITTKTFADIGEFRVFKIDFSIDLSGTSQNYVVTSSIDGYEYLEYDTCLLIEYFAQVYTISRSKYVNITETTIGSTQINLIKLLGHKLR
ncbi:hypothetical protein KEJ31_07645 [Candidatus Bathyarchaeota archaeon]|nr:hypothetical protein [Candidatus Bathyarchaeota archaeon]